MPLPRTAAVQQTAAALLAILLLAACGSSETGPGRPATGAESPRTAEYAEVLAELDVALAAARDESARYRASWGVLERIAGLHLQRAQLSGNYQDYAAARLALEQATSIAGNDTAVCSTAARLEFSVHRLPVASQALSACEQRFGLNGGERLELRGMAAEIAFYQGHYDQALDGYRAALAEDETLPGLTRLAQLHSKTGHFSEALALLDRAERQYFGDSQQLRAWLQLQRAILYLERGRWEDALAYLHAAERHLRGWWLIEEHMAEVRALLGETGLARELYQGIVERTGHPEFLDALAQLERDGGEFATARERIARAEALHRERLARWPEAAAGHALDHFLQFGSDPAEVLELARRNARLRPYGESAIRLAEALVMAGKPRKAEAEIRKVLATAWNTAELHAIAAQIFALQGRKDEAQRQRAQALSLNPRAFEAYRLRPRPE